MIKNTFRTILTVLLFALLSGVVFTLLTSKTDRFGYQSFVVLSGSMTPTIPVGSIVYTQKQPWYPVGTVITFKSGDMTVTHRVVSVANVGNTLHYSTKGDANNTIDRSIITQNSIIGAQFFAVPYIGQAVLFLRTPLGFVSLIVFPLTAFIVIELWSVKKEIEKEIEKKLKKRLMMVD